ncbi:glycerol-3-phosphate dehydrogenase/oxidase [Liquorilactobacillus mali]|nr:glycerol-3-phosphate dehydrogenase/oxidase [Liquorilactobacillus mali]
MARYFAWDRAEVAEQTELLNKEIAEAKLVDLKHTRSVTN